MTTIYNNLSRFHLDIHVLQTVAPSNLNRDRTGSPKKALFGGVRRLRVSSQSWKHAMRNYFKRNADDTENIGIRTNYISDVIISYLQKKNPDIAWDDALPLSELAMSALAVGKYEEVKPEKSADGRKHLKNKTLYFTSSMKMDKVADILLDDFGEDKDKTKAIKALKDLNDYYSLDQALFGRMVADQSSLGIDASMEVGHAIGVTNIVSESDFYTAVDDFKPNDNAGAGMIGNVEFSSSTLYRYATISIAQLMKNLDNDADADSIGEAVYKAVKAFIESMPTGKQNSFASETLPDTVIVSLRDARPISLVSAFEKPIFNDEIIEKGSVVEAADERLADKFTNVDRKFGGNIMTWVLSVDDNERINALGKPVTENELLSGVKDAVSERVVAQN